VSVIEAKSNLEAFASILRDIEGAMIMAAKNLPSSINVIKVLRKELEGIMLSSKGKQVNLQVLTPFGCQLLWETEEEEEEAQNEEGIIIIVIVLFIVLEDAYYFHVCTAMISLFYSLRRYGR
jgi:hypothetical protein